MEKRLLVVDDDPQVRKALVTLISRRVPDTVVDQAPDGEEGLRLLRETDYDAVVSDVHMPNRNGDSMVREILVSGRYDVGQFLFLCGLPMSAEWNEVVRIGGRIMPKPFGPVELISVVRRMLSSGARASLRPNGGH